MMREAWAEVVKGAWKERFTGALLCDFFHNVLVEMNVRGRVVVSQRMPSLRASGGSVLRRRTASGEVHPKRAQPLVGGEHFDRAVHDAETPYNQMPLIEFLPLK
ncbi:MAG: hypothetical protein FJ256_08310 [Phycisphaerae bacterium]|nr:hypothetical protein [Phycisphaerae bacterium]